MTDARPAAVVVLAAGEGTRMSRRTPKVLHALAGRTLLGHVAGRRRAARRRQHLVVVVGHGREQVTAHLAEVAPDATPVVQAEQHGTGHAVRIALDAVPATSTAPCVVVPGDAPLLTPQTLRRAWSTAHEAAAPRRHRADRRASTDPTGYGRVVRDADGAVAARSSSSKDADRRRSGRSARSTPASTPSTAARCATRSAGCRTDNAQGEEYLTDVVGLRRDAGRPVGAPWPPTHVETAGRQRPGAARRRCAGRCDDRLLDALDAGRRHGRSTRRPPGSTRRRARARRHVLQPDTQLHGAHARRARAPTVGPDMHADDTRSARARRWSAAHARRAPRSAPAPASGRSPTCGPAPCSAASGKIGTFVEMKNAEIGDGTKVPHLSYVGDADDRRAQPTSAPARSSSTTTASTSTAPTIGDARPHRQPTTCSSRRSTVGDGALHGGRLGDHRATCRRARSASARARSATSRAGSRASAPAPPRRRDAAEAAAGRTSGRATARGG